MLILVKIIWDLFVTENLVERRKRFFKLAEVMSYLFFPRGIHKSKQKKTGKRKYTTALSSNEKLEVPKQMKTFKIFLELLLYSQKQRSLLQKNSNLFN